MKRTIEIVGLLVFNGIGLCLGIILGLYFIQNNVSSTQDNHFLGGLYSLVEIVLNMIFGIVLVLGPIALATGIYAITKLRKKI